MTKREIVALQQSLNQNGFAYQTWARLYEILAEVEAGTRPVPMSLAEIERQLPDLTWV